MNDNDIIKALEFCESPDCECTSWCPMFYNGTNSKSDCRGELHKNAIDLINRLKAEIERLEKQLDSKCDRCIARDRAEAIKEFAERLKEHKYYDMETEYEAYAVLVDDIDSLAKEMTEEQNGNL